MVSYEGERQIDIITKNLYSDKVTYIHMFVYRIHHLSVQQYCAMIEPMIPQLLALYATHQAMYITDLIYICTVKK